jgi:hypothetical protein
MSATEHNKTTFTGARLAFLTMHDKLPLVTPALAPLGFMLELATGFDTDQLGTFSGDIARQLTPVEAALKKAWLAVELTGCRYGLGSEGSFGGGPMPGLVNWDQEILALVDRDSGQRIIASAAGPVGVGPILAQNEAELRLALSRDTPGQGRIIRLSCGQFQKGLTNADEIVSLLREQGWQDGCMLQLQPDLRAMCCPERQQYIGKAAVQLALQLQQRCPKCQAPDFSIKQRSRGLPCLVCQTPTSQVQFEHLRCDCCGYQQTNEITEQADPQYCPCCNP